MMLFKIVIFITVFVAVCFRNSEGAKLSRCRTDDEFYRAANDNRNNFVVPILVMSSTFFNQSIVDSLMKFNFGTIIILIADKIKCPVSVSYFSRVGGTSYPILYFMMKGKLYDNMWYSTMDLKTFCMNALQNQNVGSSSETIPDAIKREMEEEESSEDGHAMAHHRRSKSKRKRKKKTELEVAAGLASLAVVGGVALVVAKAARDSSTFDRDPGIQMESGMSNQRATTQAESSRNIDRTRARNGIAGQFTSRQQPEEESRRSTNTRSKRDSEYLDRESKRNKMNPGTSEP